MKIHRLGPMLVAVAALAVACSNSSDYVYIEPATVTEAGPDLWTVTLTPAAAERTGIETAAVESSGDHLVIPYSAVFYHYDGSTWTYLDQGGNSYTRAPIEIDYIEGDRAMLTDGPSAGQPVVSVGAAELYGVEFGIGK